MYLDNLSSSETFDYILWKATKILKQPRQTALSIMKQVIGQNLIRRKQHIRRTSCQDLHLHREEEVAVFYRRESIENHITEITRFTKGRDNSHYF
jgi:hypothetical protein